MDAAQESAVLSSRRGSVLGTGTILKSDHFPGAQNKKLRPIIDGAPNFRQVEGLPVYGVAIPTIDGIMNVLKECGGTVYWHNMREEPVLYINGKPFVLREMEHPFANVEYTGITSTRVEDMEQRLKKDVLREVGKYNGIMVCGESEEGDLINSWEAVEPGDVQTPREVYEDFKTFGFDVHYFRIPVTDERSPKEVDFDTLTHYVINATEGAALVFNCQMGRGRTTTAMIVASLLQVRKRASGARPGPGRGTEAASDGQGVPSWAAETFVLPGDQGASTTLSPSSLRDCQSPLDLDLVERLKTGDYLVIRSLLRVLERGPVSKSQVDAVIDACSEFQNLREGIVVYRERFLSAASEKQRNNLQRVVIDYLERYFMLITFNSYLNMVNPDHLAREGGEEEKKGKGAALGHPVACTFKQWVEQRSELYSMRERLLWHNPLTAMEVHTSAVDLNQTAKDIKQKESDESILSFIAMRTGSVLGSHTILKEDHYPGLQSPILRKLEGAPNFRRASDTLPIFGLAIPTEEGVRKVLDHIGIEPGNFRANASLIWFNMREEPVVYINGKPYVLREHARPFKNMQEYSNISTSRVESMEKRLKRDVLTEAEENGGRVLVTRERIDAEGARVINEEWEEVHSLGSSEGFGSHATAVKTPADIFESLQSEGYPIEYVRIPVTDGRAPRTSDIDDIVSQAAFTDPGTLLVFNCQGGAGRTTTGMVIGSLLHLRKQSKLTRLPPSLVLSLSRRRPSLAPCYAGVTETSDDEIQDVARDHGYRYGFSEAEGLDSSDNEYLSSVESDLKGGNYAVVNKLEHLLSYGDESKSIADAVIDVCGKLKNLRIAIFAYRKPRKKWGHSWGRGDESLQGRHAAFKNGIEYLERYFIIIAFASWLDSDSYGNASGSFYEWFHSRADLMALKKTIRTNPGAALSSAFPRVAKGSPKHEEDVHVVVGQAYKACLLSRSGVMLKRNTILKSYLFPEMQIKSLQQLPGNVFNFFQAKEVPIASASAPSVDGMRVLLNKLKEESPTSHVVIIDLREELVIYIKGLPYVLREVDFATKSLNLAGISTDQVLHRETLLKQDIAKESDKYQQQILLHREVPRSQMMKVPSREFPGNSEDSGVLSRDASKAFDVRADAQRRYLKLEAFWEGVGGEDICTASDIAEGLADEGFDMSYYRFPWSRERSPTAKDLGQLHERVRGWWGEHRHVRFLFLSHTGIGMGIRSVPVMISLFCQERQADFGGEQEREDGEVRGEIDLNRSILALTRVIPDGPKCKRLVDRAIGHFQVIGDIREDISRCVALGGRAGADEEVVATRLLAKNYLARYFFAIVYACYMKSPDLKPFADWFNERKELSHLLDQLSL